MHSDDYFALYGYRSKPDVRETSYKRPRIASDAICVDNVWHDVEECCRTYDGARNNEKVPGVPGVGGKRMDNRHVMQFEVVEEEMSAVCCKYEGVSTSSTF